MGTAPLRPGAVTISWDPASGPSAWSAWASLQDGGVRKSDFIRGDRLWTETYSSRLTSGTGTVSSLPHKRGYSRSGGMIRFQGRWKYQEIRCLTGLQSSLSLLLPGMATPASQQLRLHHISGMINRPRCLQLEASPSHPEWPFPAGRLLAFLVASCPMIPAFPGGLHVSGRQRMCGRSQRVAGTAASAPATSLLYFCFLLLSVSAGFPCMRGGWHVRVFLY